MLNKNADCYNIEKNFKYSCIISTFSEHITIFRILSIHIWQVKCQQRQTNKTKNGELFFCKLFSIIKFFFLILLREATLESKAANRNSSGFLLHNVELFSIFFTNFFGTNFRYQNKNNAVETINCFNCQLSKKYCVYYVSEHLKYCSQINEYLLNKNVCLNIVLRHLSWLNSSRLMHIPSSGLHDSSLNFNEDNIWAIAIYLFF